MPTNPRFSTPSSSDSIWHRLFGDWSVLNEMPIPAEELSEGLEQASLPSAGFFFMLALSAGIATLGLIANSAGVIIGAMIIAPLMNPIVALSYASVRGKNTILIRA